MFSITVSKKMMIIMVIIMLVAMKGFLAADEKPGGSYSYCRGPGFSEPRGFGYMDRYQWRSEQGEQLNLDRQAYLKKSQELHRQIRAKERALAEEMDRGEINKDNAMKLQKELSVLQSQMEQARLEHIIEMKKSVPR